MGYPGYGKFNTTMRGKGTLVRTAVRFVAVSSNMLGLSLPVEIAMDDSIVKPLITRVLVSATPQVSFDSLMM
jgi:hypothetical protein